MEAEKNYTCPSAPAEADNVIALGVVLGDEANPVVSYLEKGITIDKEELRKATDLDLGHFMRFAGKCAAGGCIQFQNGGCRLGKDIVDALPAVVESAPACSIRATCRWYAENGVSVCKRCPQITTRIMAGDAKLGPIARKADYLRV